MMIPCFPFISCWGVGMLVFLADVVFAELVSVPARWRDVEIVVIR